MLSACSNKPNAVTKKQQYNYNNSSDNKVFQSQASWDKLEMKPKGEATNKNIKYY
jgi:hypothetical protein